MAEQDVAVTRIKAAFDDVEDDRRQFHLNQAFLTNKQRVYWDTKSKVVRAAEPDGAFHVIANRMLPATRSLMALLTRRPLTFQVMPEAADDAAARASRLAESVIRSRAVDKGWERLRKHATWGLWIGGTAGLALDWDPTAERTISELDDGRKVGTGDCVESVLTILDFAAEPGVADPERAFWWVRAESMSPEVAKERYGLSELPNPNSRPVSAMYRWRNQRPSDNKAVTVYTYYERPHGKVEGCVKVVIGEKVVQKGAWPFPFTDRLNLTVGVETVIPNRWNGETVLSSARTIQHARNEAFSAVVDHTRKAGATRHYIPESAAALIEELTDEAGQTVAYPDGIEKPWWDQPADLPSHTQRTPEMLGEELDDLLGHHAISRGEAPGRVDSGLGLSILSENDNSPLGSVTSEMARMFSTLASMVLATYAAKVKDSRQQKVTAKPGQPAEVVRWTGADLKGHTTAEVPVDAIMPRSRAATNQMAMDLLGAGVITEPTQVAKLLDYPGMDDVMQVVNPHIAKARRENHKLSLGRQIIPMDLDDENHLASHVEFMLSETYELAAPEVQEIIADHIEAHRKILSETTSHTPEGPLQPPGEGAAPPAPPVAPEMPMQPELPMPMPMPEQPVMPGPGAPPLGSEMSLELLTEMLGPNAAF